MICKWCGKEYEKEVCEEDEICAECAKMSYCARDNIRLKREIEQLKVCGRELIGALYESGYFGRVRNDDAMYWYFECLSCFVQGDEPELVAHKNSCLSKRAEALFGESGGD